jgi:hypothetical protein
VLAFVNIGEVNVGIHVAADRTTLIEVEPLYDATEVELVAAVQFEVFFLNSPLHQTYGAMEVSRGLSWFHSVS